MRAEDIALAGKVAEQLFDSALVSACMLEEPPTVLKRVNDLMKKLGE